MDWHENMIPAEIPPEWMWPFADEVNNWFEDIKADKEASAGSDEPVELVKNEDPRLIAARGLKG